MEFGLDVYFSKKNHQEKIPIEILNGTYFFGL